MASDGDGRAVKQGAVLYDTRDNTSLDPVSDRALCHVVSVYEEVDTGDRLFNVWDGTHTYQEFVHEERLLEDFEPAGWTFPRGKKPLYHLTRNCGVEDPADLMTDGGQDVEITHDEARDESRCGLFCDAEPEVSFEAFGYTFHRCRDCYEEPCSRCDEEIEDDSNKPKGWCQSCREEIRLICGGDEERGIEKDEDSEQATLMTDGGQPEGQTDGTNQSESPFPEVGTRWQTPYGMDRCPVCACRAGLLLSEEPNTCKCGAELGGLSTTKLLAVPDRGERDIIIRASEGDVRHKVFDYCDGTDLGENPRRSMAYWTVSGTPQRTGPGRVIMFTTDGDTVDYYAPICYVEEGRIWFDFLSPTKLEAPAEPPTRGFKYVDWGEFPW